MTDFNFANVTVTKSADVPALTRNREKGPNPLAKVYASAMKDLNTFYQLPAMPGKEAQEEYTTDKGEKKTRTTYGPTVKKACAYLRSAAADAKHGVTFRYTDNGDGTVTVHFAAKVKRDTSK